MCCSRSSTDSIKFETHSGSIKREGRLFRSKKNIDCSNLFRNSVRSFTGFPINHIECLFIRDIILVKRVVIIKWGVFPGTACKFK
mgnify:CR=1 FL=1